MNYKLARCFNAMDHILLAQINAVSIAITAALSAGDILLMFNPCAGYDDVSLTRTKKNSTSKGKIAFFICAAVTIIILCWLLFG